MTTQEKIKVILDAIASKKATANQIEPSRKGATIAAIKRGETPKPSTIEKLYASLQSVLAGKAQEPVIEKQKPQEKQKTQSDDSITVLSALSARVAALEKENTELKATVTDLVSRVASQAKITKDNQVCDTQTASITKDNKISDILTDGDNLTVLGIDFNIRFESQTVNVPMADGTEKKIEYKRYYAKKRIKGKLHRVYLGDISTRDETIEKVKIYCQKHGLVT